MKRKHVIISGSRRGWLAGLVALTLLAGQARAQYDPDWARNFRVGALVGVNVKATFKMSGTFPTGGNNPPSGEFDDGFVRVDSTGNDGNITTYWGYDNSSQYDAAARTLTMHRTTSYSTTGPGDNAHEESSTFVGLDMAYGGNLWYWKNLRFGWDLGVGLLPIKLSDHQTINVTTTRSAFDFNADGIQPFTLPPGYRGGPGGPGQQLPAIGATGASAGGDTQFGTVTGSRTLDVNLYTVRLGPSVYWDVSRCIGISAGAGPAIGVVNGDLKFNETVNSGGGSAPNRGHTTSTDVLYGGYVNAMVMYHTVKNGDIYLGVQFMPLGKTTFSGGGRQAQLDLSGAVYISGGINWPF